MTEAARPSLLESYSGLICDLDGVVYRGGAAVPGAVEALNRAIEAGAGVVYATNNASRTPQSVAEQLCALGLSARSERVVTSSQAGADRLARTLGEGGAVLAIGGPGVVAALSAARLCPVTSDEHRAGRPVGAVLQGYGPEVGWADLAEAAYAIQSGAEWIATNMDLTLPTERGTAPGNGTLVGAVRRAVDRDPEVVGKPRGALYELSARVLGVPASATLAVGDRLDTDIVGANVAGVDALLVLTGVHGPGELARARGQSRPTYVATGLAALHEPYAAASRATTDTWSCGSATARVGGTDDRGDLSWPREGSADEMLRAATAALWACADAGTLEPARLEEAIGQLEAWWAGLG